MACLQRVVSEWRKFTGILSSLPTARIVPITISLGLAVTAGNAMAQSAAKGSPDHIKAVTSAVDSASIKANTATSQDWPTIGVG